MKITFSQNRTQSPTETREILMTRIGRILARFGARIAAVTVRAREKVIGEHGRPRASCSVECSLASGGTIHVAAQDTHLLPAIAKLCDSLSQSTSRDLRLGSRQKRHR